MLSFEILVFIKVVNKKNLKEMLDKREKTLNLNQTKTNYYGY